MELAANAQTKEKKCSLFLKSCYNDHIIKIGIT